ncbi:hypothetical protein EYF80_007525 [Liparis tanakae]|uniref:Uncharacterized protein n=1 Tax=Liparis tanakae TaxID=230148 RepID=A0A4Z2IWL5_9TELE|nr:hypothetical protein EYF80_007525 [Liparis tanakae]
MSTGNGDEMLMCLLVMHCSKQRNQEVEEEEIERGRGQTDQRKRGVKKIQKEEDREEKKERWKIRRCALERKGNRERGRWYNSSGSV